jgi:hypothetical protein
MRRIRRPSHATVVAYVALFVALGGGTTAVALNGSNTVQSDDLGPGAQVKKPDIAAAAVGVNKVAPDSIDSSKVIDDSLTGPDVAANALTGDNIDESSLGEVPSATLGGLGGNSATFGPCNPESTTFTTCATAGLTLPARSRVLVIGQIRAEPDTGGGNGGGSCRVGSLTESTAPVFVNGGQTDAIAISGVVGVVGPGTIQFLIECNEEASGIRYFDAHLSLVALSPAV